MKSEKELDLEAVEKECWDITVYQMLEKLHRWHGEKEMFFYRQEGIIHRITYRRFFQDVMRLAGYFDRIGLQKKSVVIDGRNTYEQIVALFAAAAMGAVAAPVCFDLALDDLRELIDRIAPALVVYDREDEDILGEVTGKLDPVLLPCTEEGGISNILEESGALYQGAGQPSPEAPALLLVTSGSSSRGKLVLLSHYSLLPHSRMESERSLYVLPMYHAASLFALVDDIVHGIPICLSDFRRAQQDIEWFHPRDVFGVPSFVALLVKHSMRNMVDLRGFRSISSGGAPQNIEQVRYLNSLGIFSMSLYGATETSGTITYATRDCYRSGSVGKPGPWSEVRISDSGEILVRSKILMLGYLDDPEATREAIRDGWYHTGDMGYLDKDGFLFITGRIKNIIILSNGENVSPEAVEAKLSACEEIEEVEVCGENDRITAYVWCGKDANENRRDRVREFITMYNRTVPSYHGIRRVVFQEEPLKKTASGKLKRRTAAPAEK